MDDSPHATRLRAMADLIADDSGYDLTDVTLLALVDHAIVKLVNQAVHFELVASNKDRPDAKYGTNPDGSPAYAPEWYTAQGIKTHIHEGLWGCLRGVLSCEHQDEHGHWCTGSLLHDSVHWDGNGCNWLDDGIVIGGGAA